MHFDFTNHTDAQLESRAAEILVEMTQDGANLEELRNEAQAIQTERDARAAEAQRREIRTAVANGAGRVIASAPQEQRRGAAMALDSAEYRRAFLQDLNGEELTPETRSAFVATTGNTTAPLPTTMLNQIWDLVSTEHSILGDITMYRTGTILEVVKHTAIAQGAAASVNENAANDDEQNTFVKVTLSGKDFSKHIDVSYAFGLMSIDALESYLVKEIASGLSAAMATDVVTQIGTDMAVANKIQTAAANKVTFTDVAGLLALLERAEHPIVYARRSFIYKHLVGMVDTTGRPIFQLNAQDGAEGYLIGCPVKVEDAVAATKMLAGDSKKVVYNMVQDVMIESDRDIKKHVTTYSGYARGSGALIADKAFAELTVKSGT